MGNAKQNFVRCQKQNQQHPFLHKEVPLSCCPNSRSLSCGHWSFFLEVLLNRMGQSGTDDENAQYLERVWLSSQCRKPCSSWGVKTHRNVCEGQRWLTSPQWPPDELESSTPENYPWRCSSNLWKPKRVIKAQRGKSDLELPCSLSSCRKPELLVALGECGYARVWPLEF